jgi:hypothetical protein
VTIRIADALSSARGRLSTRVRELRRAGSHALYRLMSRVRGRLAPEPDDAFVDAARETYRATAYEETTREAYWAAATRRADPPLAPAPASGGPASAMGAAIPSASPSAPESDAHRVRESAQSPEANEQPADGPTAEPGAAAPEPAVEVPASEPAPGPDAAERPARRSRRKTGETAPDHLLLPGVNADSTADDFFGRLERRVEGDR